MIRDIRDYIMSSATMIRISLGGFSPTSWVLAWCLHQWAPWKMHRAMAWFTAQLSEAQFRNDKSDKRHQETSTVDRLCGWAKQLEAKKNHISRVRNNGPNGHHDMMTSVLRVLCRTIVTEQLNPAVIFVICFSRFSRSFFWPQVAA